MSSARHPDRSREERWIDSLRQRIGSLPPRRFPVDNGDDAAVWRPRPGHDVVLSVDVQAENTHFRRDWMPLETVGKRAVTASVSDLAAMAARPGALLISLLLPGEFSDRELARLARGLHAGSVDYGIPIAGGNISRGPLSITVTSIGEVERGRAIRRGGLRVGDEIWVTGSPGLAHLGFLQLDGSIKRPRGGRSAIDAFLRPRARLEPARWLASRWPLRAMIDLSDGLGRDVAQLLGEETGLGGDIERDALATLPTSKLCMAAEIDPARVILEGGEDYELCFAAAPDSDAKRAARAFERRWQLPLTRVGRVVNKPGLRLVGAGATLPISRTELDFEHFD